MADPDVISIMGYVLLGAMTLAVSVIMLASAVWVAVKLLKSLRRA